MCNNDNIKQLAKRKLIFASATTHAVQTIGQYDSCKIEQRATRLLCDIVNTKSIFYQSSVSIISDINKIPINTILYVNATNKINAKMDHSLGVKQDRFTAQQKNFYHILVCMFKCIIQQFFSMLISKQYLYHYALGTYGLLTKCFSSSPIWQHSRKHRGELTPLF